MSYRDSDAAVQIDLAASPDHPAISALKKTSRAVSFAKVDGLDGLIERKRKLEERIARAPEGEPLNIYEAEVDKLREKIKAHFALEKEVEDCSSSQDVEMRDHGTPRRRKHLADITNTMGPSIVSGTTDDDKAPSTPAPTPVPTFAEVAARPPQVFEGQATPKARPGMAKKKAKSIMVRKVPTDFKVVNLVKKKKRFDGMTFKLDGSFTLSAKEVFFGKSQNSMEAISIERHYQIKHPSNDGSYVNKVSPLNLPRRLLDTLITAVSAIVKSKEAILNNLPLPEPGKDGTYDLSFLTKGMYTRDRYILDPLFSIQVEEISFTNARGSGVFDVLAITKTLSAVDKSTKKQKTFVQQVPVRLLPGFLHALQTIAKYTREVEKTVNADGEVEVTVVE